jgi:ubiquinone/menaquinone biosynthesis C-methylase UbiE
MAYIEFGVRVPFRNYMTSPERAERVVKWFFGAEKLEGKILVDLGCGIGTVLAEIEKQFPTAMTIGVDKSDEYLEEARKRVSGQLIGARLEELPLPDESVDVAVSRRIYVPFNEDCSGIAVEIQRILRQGGVYVADEAPGYHAHRDALKDLGMEVARHMPLTLVKP